MNSFVIDQLSFERDDLMLFQNVDAEWCSGDIVQLVGHNGSGKTTLMRILMGLLYPTEGSVHWNGHSVNSYEFRSSSLYLGHHVGVKATMTPYENLHWFFSLHGTKSKAFESVSRGKLISALSEVGLAAYSDVPCYQLSAGQQRRVALARLTLSEAPFWVLDEPFTAIDKSGVTEMERLIDRHASKGGIVVLTTHQTWAAERVKLLNLESFKAKEGGRND